MKCGYRGKLRFNDLSNGSGCRQCGILRRADSRKLDFDAFRRDMAKKKIEILSSAYTNSDTKLRLRCSILEGHGCDECYMERMRKPLQLSDGRIFESGTAAAKALGVRKETVNKAAFNGWKVKGFGVKRVS